MTSLDRFRGDLIDDPPKEREEREREEIFFLPSLSCHTISQEQFFPSSSFMMTSSVAKDTSFHSHSLTLSSHSRFLLPSIQFFSFPSLLSDTILDLVIRTYIYSVKPCESFILPIHSWCKNQNQSFSLSFSLRLYFLSLSSSLLFSSFSLRSCR